MAANDSAGRLRLASQLRDDAKVGPNPNSLIALAWTLTEIVESGVYVDDLWDDIQEAQKALDDAVAIEPELMPNDLFVRQQERTAIIHDRVRKFEQAKQARLREYKSYSDSDLSAQQAADIAYASKKPEETAHYFLLAAQKIKASNPAQATWYLNSRTTALLDLRRWDEAEPQLRQMTRGNTNVDAWIEQGFIGLLRIAAAKSDSAAFKAIWRQARSARPDIPGQIPSYYKVLRFGIELDLLDFVGPVFKKLTENDLYIKSKEDEELLELASDYITQKSLQTPWDKFRSFFRFQK